MKGVELCVIAGDPQQLPPTVKSQEAVACQLDRTLFTRIAETPLQREARLERPQVPPSAVLSACPSDALSRHQLSLLVGASYLCWLSRVNKLYSSPGTPCSRLLRPL